MRGCVGVSTCNWMLLWKGAYCNVSLWHFYENVWKCFLAKLVAARHVLHYYSELCVHSEFCVKMIIWGVLFLLRSFTGLWLLTDFIPLGISNVLFVFSDCVKTWKWNQSLPTASRLDVSSNSPSAMFRLDRMQCQCSHPSWTKYHNLMQQQYLILD